MVQQSRSSGRSGLAFDFSTPTAVMLVLKALRAFADVSVTERNEIRDQIFSYVNGAGDEATLQAIESKLTAIGLTPDTLNSLSKVAEAEATPKKEAPKAGFASSRNVPSFDYVASKPPAQDLPTSNNQATGTTKLVETKPLAETLAQVVSPVPKILPNIPTVNTLTKVSVAEKSVFKDRPTQPLAPAQNTTFVPASLPDILNTDLDTTPFLERIRIIKADINAKAGNPVNLVSIDKEVGREYMTSLLDAMKQLWSGNVATVSSSMKRLEVAYEQALSVLEISKLSQTKKISNDKPQIPVSTVPSPTPTQSRLVQTQSVPTHVRSAPVLVPRMYEPSAQTVQSHMDTVSQSPALRSEAKSVAPVPPKFTAQAVSLPYSNPPLGATRSFREATKAPTVGKVAPAVAHPNQVETKDYNVQIHSSKLSDIKSVATATPLRRIEELPTLTETKNYSANGNPLYTGEISEGLEQLLSEWSIFRKSGVFGTGPHGSEHPLFKKLSGLKIPLIIAGRFEGATEEVRQSITDYMNGWRYEQGIVYNKEETFEEYLRRIIHHIIDSQKK